MSSGFERRKMDAKTQPYNERRNLEWEDYAVPKKMKIEATENDERFGPRLERLRKAAGFSLRELATEIGTSHRMLVYYEKHTEHPPAHLLTKLAQALEISTDQLLGVEKVKETARTRDTRLWRRFSQVEKLSPAKRKPIVQVLDAFLKSEKA
jgi:transcriptional regulator with XRE-family HTH domain